MSAYPFDSFARAVVVSSLSVLVSPSVSELESGTDVTCELVPSGLSVERSTATVDRSRWRGDQTSADPTRWSTSVTLTAFRSRQDGDPEVLRGLATFRARALLVVRYGLRFDTPWRSGQEVEVLSGRWGKRSTARSARNQAATYSVPLIVEEDVDDALVS